MNNKAVIVTAVIASILVVGMISPIGPVYAHVNVCSSSNDHDKDGIPFSALWAAVCDMQHQIDNLQNQINNLPVGGGTQSNINAKFVKLTSIPTCASSTSSGIPVGWCPSLSSSYYLIQDSAVGPNSVIQTSTVNSVNPIDAVYCPVQSLNYTETGISGFLILCNTNVDPNTDLNYVILNPAITTPPVTCTLPQVLQNGVCVTPPVVCTPPQVLQNGVCVTPPVVCTPPQVLQNGVCVTPPVVCTPDQTLQNGVCIPQWDKDHHHTKGERVFYQKDGHNVLYTCTADVTSNTTPDKDNAHWTSTTPTSDDGFSNYKNENKH